MTEREALKLALEALKHTHPSALTSFYTIGDRDKAIKAIQEHLAQPEQKPVAMKFKIYKPTVPDPTRQDINNALLPWVYDQDRASGFDATMWVTPVATLPPQRKPLTDKEIADNWLKVMWAVGDRNKLPIPEFARAIEAAHGIKGEA